MINYDWTILTSRSNVYHWRDKQPWPGKPLISFTHMHTLTPHHLHYLTSTTTSPLHALTLTTAHAISSLLPSHILTLTHSTHTPTIFMSSPPSSCINHHHSTHGKSQHSLIQHTSLTTAMTPWLHMSTQSTWSSSATNRICIHSSTM